ncbi:MAG TPA: phytanoyl-CoA dioxygenase family protein [Pyrinomonadaceae bacterium]|nr:phytanoyl-CoA dioxygenase family protein [Pyrinomonadaceae bacterium]
MWLTAQQIDHYHEHGFLVVRNYFSPDEIEIMLDELPHIFSQDTPRRILEKSGAVRTVFASHTDNEVYNTLSRLPRLVEPAKQLLDSDVYIHQFKINAKVALEGEQWEWHQDFLYWHKEDGMPRSRVVTAAVFLQECNEFNGPMLITPGSHREGMIDVEAQRNGNGNEPAWMPTLTADLKYKINKEILSRVTQKNNIVAVKGGAGFVLFFDGNLFHASSNNLSPRDRISVFVSYNSVENALAEVVNPRPEFIASRDFKPITAVSDDALLELGAAVRSIGVK